MLDARSSPLAQARRLGPWFFLLTLLGSGPAVGSDPFARFDFPDAWEARFWSDPNVKALLALEPKAVAELVPVQAGLRHCRCPNCDATEADDPLVWSVTKPQILTCKRCGVTVPNDKYPAKDEKEKKVPEEAVEVLPHVIHHYPYHEVEPEKQRYPEERLYLAAKRDYEAREFLAKAALYAAVRYHEQPAGRQGPPPRTAGLHLDPAVRPGVSRLRHPLRPARPTQVFPAGQLAAPLPAWLPDSGRWDWTASLDVPMNLVIAYALLRDDPALVEAGRLLGEPNPARTIERDLFRASAEFVRLQPEEFNELSLQAYRGLLAVGHLLNDPALIREALRAARRVRRARVLPRRLLAPGRRGQRIAACWACSTAGSTGSCIGPDGPRGRDRAGERGADAGAGPPGGLGRPDRPRAAEIQQAAWPAPTTASAPRRPVLLGGAGVARLAVGQGADALDLEVRGQRQLRRPAFPAPGAPPGRRRPAGARRPRRAATRPPPAGTAPPPATTRSWSMGSTSASRSPRPPSPPPAATSSSSPPTLISRSRPWTTRAPIPSRRRGIARP